MSAGTEEGGFAWLTLNYLLGHLGKKEDDTVAAIDLVGLCTITWLRGDLYMLRADTWGVIRTMVRGRN